MKLKPSKNESFIHYHEIFLNGDMEYGLTDKQSFLLGLSLYKNIAYKYAYIQNGNSVIKQDKHHYSLPVKFNEITLGVKQHLFSANNITSSASMKLLLKHHAQKKLVTEIAFGTSGYIKQKEYFVDVDFSKSFAIKKDIDSYNANLTFGIHQNKKNSYMIQFFNYYKRHYYDYINNKQLLLPNPYYENKISISKIKTLKPNIKLQQSIYNSLNSRKSLRVYGYTFSLWVDL